MSSLSSLPRSVTIIRHGEKPTSQNHLRGIDERGQERPDSLAPRGWQRAGALAALLGGPRVPRPFARPEVLYACGYADNPDGRRHRPYETLLPLAARLGLEIQVPVLNTAAPELVGDHVLPEAGKDVLVCWQHKNIPALVAALADELGVHSVPAPGREWPDDDFHSALIFSRLGRGYRLRLVSQNVLAGD